MRKVGRTGKRAYVQIKNKICRRRRPDLCKWPSPARRAGYSATATQRASKRSGRRSGSANTYTIDQAREKARLCRIELAEGRSPSEWLAGGRAESTGKTFGEAMEDYLAAKAPTWAASNRDRELRRYRFLFSQIPDFTALPVKGISQDVKNTALATWSARSKQRRDVGFYIEAIIRYAETGKLRVRANRGDPQHFEAMPYADVPAFFKGIADLESVDARALQWTILTGARTDEVIGADYKGKVTKAPATWEEITDVDGLPVWVIPADRMKGGKVHRIPLTPQMVALLGKRRADKVPLFVVSSQNALLGNLKANGGNGFTVHGFRTSFTEWVAHETDFPDELADRCIAHERRTKVRRAYQRSDLLEKRREIMQAWSDFVTSNAC